MRFALRYTVLAAVAALCGLSACSGDDVTAKDSTAAGGTAYVSVRLLVAQPEATRLGPAGGADGDGREPGMDRENAVSDVTLLLYRQSDASTGLNGDGTATVEHTVYFPTLVASADGTAYTSEAAECGITAASGAWHAIVVANMGDVSTEYQGKTVACVRDDIIKEAWTPAADAEQCDGFAMASAEDATLGFADGDGSRANPYTLSTSVERLAARIDIAPGGGAWSAADGTYTYRVLAEGGTDTGDRFVLRSVTPVNVMAAGSYLLKRVCGEDGAGIEYLGAETADGQGRQTNWVLDPWTLKGKDATLYADATAHVATKPTAHTDADGDSYYILAYAMENTTLDNNPAFATSLRFTGTYYKAAEWNEETGGPADGATGEEKTFTYTLRHSDPDGADDASQPMLYGTVRNNIYRVKIDGVAYEGGSPQLQATINVRKWALFSHSGIVM